MANILKFPERSEEVRNHEFLQDDDDILRFDDVNQKNDFAFSPPEEPSFLRAKRARSKDWSNQELADLFRVKRLLDAAGVPNDIDRGITDEGDPWFLFCDACGEVFIHLCRLDGIYVLDSPNIETPLRGYDFNGLIEQFTDRQLPGSGAQSNYTDQRVVRLERNGKVFLHPSTMLTALIWTLFLASEELVMILPEESSETLYFGNKLAAAPNSPNQNDAFDVSHMLAHQEEQVMNDDQETSSKPVAQHLRDLTAFNDTKLGQNTYAVGLSAVAIALGFMSEVQVSDIDDMTLENILALLAGSDGGAGQGNSNQEKFGLDQSEAQDFLASLTQVLYKISVSVDDADKSGAPTSDGHIHTTLVNQIQSFLQDIEQQFSGFVDDRVQPDDSSSSGDYGDVASATSNNESMTGVVQDILVPQAVDTVQETEQMAYMLSRFGLTNTAWSHDTSVREYTIDNDTIFATFDINASKLNKTNTLISSSLETEKSDEGLVDIKSDSFANHSKFQPYNDAAYEFVSYLTSKDNELEVVATSSELILLDPEVFDVDESEAFVMSWFLENGDIISTIGLRSDYEFYDMIA